MDVQPIILNSSQYIKTSHLCEYVLKSKKIRNATALNFLGNDIIMFVCICMCKFASDVCMCVCVSTCVPVYMHAYMYAKCAGVGVCAHMNINVLGMSIYA